MVWADGHGIEVEKQSIVAVFTFLLSAPLQVRNAPSSSIVLIHLSRKHRERVRNQNYCSVVFNFSKNDFLYFLDRQMEVDSVWWLQVVVWHCV